MTAVISPYVKRVVIADPKQVSIIAHAKIKTDTIDVVLWQLPAAKSLTPAGAADLPRALLSAARRPCG